MPKGIEHRELSPLLKAFRDFCRGRPAIDAGRHADSIAARTQPPPTIPGGPYHKSNKVYYYTRDARRLVEPPIVVLAQKKLAGGKSEPTEVKTATPGKVYAPE